MNESQRNITLIGMPGVGKSTVGVLLAKAMGRNFVDTDIFIQAGTGRELQDIIDTDGLDAFCEIERDYILCLDVPGYVIATGGSVVYHSAAMQHLKSCGLIVWLDLPLEILRNRLDNLSTRGLVKPPDKTIEELYAERRELYARWADTRIDCENLTQDQAVQAILVAIPLE